MNTDKNCVTDKSFTTQTPKLYRIHVRHCAPKASLESIKTYAIAFSDQDVMENIDEQFAYGVWKDRYEEAFGDEGEDGQFVIYDEKYNEIGTENYLEKMLRLKGEFFDEDADYDDLYYGKTHYGWETVTERISSEEINILLAYGVAVDWRK